MTTIISNFVAELSRIKEDQRIVGRSDQITLKSDSKTSDPVVVEQGLWSKSIAELSTGQIIDFSKLDNIEAATRFVELTAGAKLQAKAFDRICTVIVSAWSVSFREDGFAQLSTRLPLNVVHMIKEAIAKRELEIQAFHGTSEAVETVDNYNSIYSDIFNSGNKLFALNGGMGSRKTHALRKTYSASREAEKFPIYLVGKRSIVFNFFSADHADHYQTTSTEDSQGLVGVINTIVSSKHYADRERCKVVLIDEVEDLFDHIATGTLGMTFEDRITAMERLESLIRGAEKVVVADAMITDRTIRKLEKMAGDKAKIIKVEVENCGKIKIVKESEVIALAREDMKAGKKVAIFCDYRAEKFADIANSVRENSGKNVIEITADSLKKQNKTLDDIDSILDKSDAAIISPVINAGASIEMQDYDRVYVISGGTLAPTSILQSVRRFRAAKTAHIAFRSGNTSKRITEAQSIIFEQVKVTAKSPVKNMLSLFENKHGRFLAQHAAGRNEQFANFKQTLIIAAEQMGFTVEHAELTAAQRKSGTKAKAVGRRKTEEVCQEVAFEASEKKRACKISDIDFGEAGAQNFAQEVSARTVDAMDLLSIKELDEQTYAEIFKLDIDRIVLKRKQIDNSAEFGRRGQIAFHIAARFLDESGFSFDKPDDSEITKEKTEAAFEALIDPVELETGAAISGLALIKMAFQSVDFSKKYRTQIVKDMVKALGYDMIKTGTEKKVAIYGITELIRKIDGEHVNVTEIADSYMTAKPDLSFAQTSDAVLIAVTQDEIKLQQQIDRKAFKAIVDYEAERAEMLYGTM
jgi:hypothetical protein